MSWGFVAIAGVTLAAQVGTSMAAAHQNRKLARETTKANKKALAEAEALQKSADQATFNSTQRAARLTASRNLNTGRQGTILGGGVNLAGANTSTQTTPTKTLLGQ